jgi:hypothetical protein
MLEDRAEKLARRHGGEDVIPWCELRERIGRRNRAAFQAEVDRHWAVYGKLLDLIQREKPDKALGMLVGAVLHILTLKHGKDAERKRPDLNTFCREVRRAVFYCRG